MTPAELSRLVDDWIELCKTREGSQRYGELIKSSYRPVWHLVENDPHGAWAFILTVMTRATDDQHVLSNLAAGPLEDLLVKHGLEMISYIEREARQNDAFADLLADVWQNEMNDDIWRKVQNAVRRR